MRLLISLIAFTGLLAASGCGDEPSPRSGACPDWSSNSVHNYANEDFSNFGCAYRNNLAAQLADPEDMKRGRGNEMSNGERESVNIEKYMTVTQQPVTSPSTGANSAR